MVWAALVIGFKKGSGNAISTNLSAAKAALIVFEMGNELMSEDTSPQAEMVVRPSVPLRDFPDYYFNKLAGCAVMTSRPSDFHSVSHVFGYMPGSTPRRPDTSFPCMGCRRLCFDGGLPKKLRCTCGQIQLRLEDGRIV